MKLWWLPPSVAISLIVSGTALILGSIWLIPADPVVHGQPVGVPGDSARPVRVVAALIGIGLGAGMIVNGIARSTRPPEGPK